MVSLLYGNGFDASGEGASLKYSSSCVYLDKRYGLKLSDFCTLPL